MSGTHQANPNRFFRGLLRYFCPCQKKNMGRGAVLHCNKRLMKTSRVAYMVSSEPFKTRGGASKKSAGHALVAKEVHYCDHVCVCVTVFKYIYIYIYIYMYIYIY